MACSTVCRINLCMHLARCYYRLDQGTERVSEGDDVPLKG